MKYIIKNCDICFENFEANFICPYGTKKEGLTAYCKDISDCLLKRIVDIFKDFRKDSVLINGNKIMVEEILNLLEIEEVNE